MYRWAFIIGVPLLSILVHYGMQQLKPKVKTPKELNPQYDYIIIGGGTAGNVLAARLSEDEKTSVLLLEAGGEEDELFYSHIPSASPLLQGTDFDWQYSTVPQDHCCAALIEKRVKWPRGKVLGGSSVLHFSHYVRGHPDDFAAWTAGDSGGGRTSDDWSPKSVEAYFKLIEAVGGGSALHRPGRGASGTLALTENDRLDTPLGRDFVAALTAAGYGRMTDSALPERGFGRPQFMIKGGKRISTVSAYLRPAMRRSNLHVVTRAKVTRITFNYNDEEKRAAGVEYEYQNSKHRVLTNKEIIITAGSVASPQILMLSGIGPREHLESMNIQPIQDSPHVGQNLKDHVSILIRYSINQPAGLNAKEMLSFTGLLKSALEYFFYGSGHLAYPPLEYMGFLNSQIEANSKAPPDLQFYFAPLNLLEMDFLNLTNFHEPEASDVPIDPSGKSEHSFSLGVVLLKPQSSGQIRLLNDDPLSPPLIDPKYFQNEADFAALSAGLKSLDAILSSDPSFRKYGLKMREYASSAVCDPFSMERDRFLECLVRNRPQTAYHPSGTCRIGSDSSDGVVDSELRVHGVKGLRVVDASIFPEPVSANPCATVIMLAEKAADIIKRAARFSST